ncbi:MAG: family transcriptional regulator [Candidatus Solibacter sp.]|jgi:transcriptional regulator with XRE-family HTH domain|nr:family transcriptional regulator [Candidatus Solibacter sp.]
MDRPGEKLKRVRERLKLTYRDVEKASQQIAARRESDDFAIALSRLADIENKGTVPTMFRLYSLCAIYRLDAQEVLRWYGVPLEMLPSESLNISLNDTHLAHFSGEGPATVPNPPEFSIDLNSTTFLSHVVRRWGKGAIRLLNGVDMRQHRFGFVGLEDWSMHPVLHPGALVLIDEGRRRIATSGWTTELDRPIYFLEHRTRYLCGWCSQTGDQLLVQPHPSSQQNPVNFATNEIDVIGQVVGVAMLLEVKKRRHARSAGVPAESPNP